MGKIYEVLIDMKRAVAWKIARLIVNSIDMTRSSNPDIESAFREFLRGAEDREAKEKNKVYMWEMGI